jgi:two-component system, OmpR family, response regulator
MLDLPIRVLVVDDLPDTATSMGRVLEMMGFQAEMFFDARKALKEVIHFQPHACVLDIIMPGMNGYDLAQQIQQLLPDRYCLMIALTGIEILDPKSGFDVSFTKPANPLAIVNYLKRYFGLRLSYEEDNQTRRNEIQEGKTQTVG